jgi:AraC-like DNA-binding protein
VGLERFTIDAWGGKGQRTAMSIERLFVDSRDSDEATEKLALVAPNAHLLPAETGSFSAVAEAWALPGMGLFSVSLGHGRVESSEHSFYGLTIPHQGELEIGDGARRATFSPGMMHCMIPDRQFSLRAAESGTTLVANLDASLAERHLRAWDATGAVPALDAEIGLEGGLGASLRAYVKFLLRELERADSSLRSPLVAAEAANRVASLAAAVILGPPRSSKDKGASHSEYDALRRAEEYLAAHLSVAVALPDVAEACGLSVRSLTRTFRKHYGMGPIRFLRERRFDAAHSELAATRGEASVTAVALKYGFTHLGRFAAEYTGRFGQNPSETLAGVGAGPA